ncbi:MAG: DUF6597 domain-containing transcriptional factor [Ferruginibacter sp.]
MKVTYLTPIKKISDYVQSILVIENYQLTNIFQLPLFANGTPTLLFHTSKGEIKNNSNYLTLFGQTVLPEKLFLKNDFVLIAYFLKPWSLASLFGVSAKELTDNPVDFNLLSKNNNLQEKLLNAKTTNQMLSLLDDFIFSKISKNNASERLVKYASEKIIDNPHKNILVEIQNELCITERTFQRIFEKSIGISPNHFRKINQFNQAFQQLNTKQYKSLSEVAFGQWFIQTKAITFVYLKSLLTSLLKNI